MSIFIHDRAYVDKDCTIGDGSRIWQFANVVRGAQLGSNCVVAPFANVDAIRCGDRCHFSAGFASGRGCIIGDDCFFGPNVSLCNDAFPRPDKEGFDMLDPNFVAVRIGNRVSIGANAVILPGVTLGDDSMIAAGVTCTGWVPAGHLLMRDGRFRPYDREETARFRMRRCAT